MRVRFSRKLNLLTKTFFLSCVLWLAYVFLAPAPSSAAGAAGEDGGGRSLRQFASLGGEDGGRAAEQLTRPVYVKAPADSNAPGEWGKATRLNLGPEEKKLEEDSVERYAINIYVSDKISLHRHIQDNRMYE